MAASPAGLLTLLNRLVVRPFDRISDIGVVVVLLRHADPENSDPPPNPGHPACAEYVGSEYCRESWQLHLADLRQNPRAHFHTCAFNMYCGLIPVVHQACCLAAVRVACPTSRPEADFERHVGLLDVLVENFIAEHRGFLGRLIRVLRREKPASSGTPSTRGPRTARSPAQPRVIAAISHIDRHLADPDLSIGRIAGVLGLHANYLSHLFAETTGQRMCRYIMDRRLRLAKRLLSATTVQVKQVAGQCGFAHPNWFSYVFTEHVGCSPAAYRNKRRRPARPQQARAS